MRALTPLAVALACGSCVMLVLGALLANALAGALAGTP